MKELGKVLLRVWVSAEEADAIKKRAQLDGRKTATWIRGVVVEAATGLYGAQAG